MKNDNRQWPKWYLETCTTFLCGKNNVVMVPMMCK